MVTKRRQTNTEAEHSILPKTNFALQFFQNYKWQLIIFFAIFLPLGASRLMFFGTIAAGDEFGTIGSGTFFAGLDWSRTVSLFPFYGFGYTILFAPLFLLDLPFDTIVIIMRMTNTVLTAFGGVIAYNMMTRIFGIQDIKITVFTSIAAACVSANILDTNLITNDSMQIFLNWVVLYLLLSMVRRIEADKSNIVQSILLSILMCYGLLVHTRIIFIWGAIFVFILCYAIISRKILVSLPAFLPSLILLFILSRFLLDYVQYNIWSVYGDDFIGNTIESTAAWWFTGEALSDRLSFNSLIAFFRPLVGLSFSASVHTAGLVLLLFTALIACLVCLVWKKTRLQTIAIIKDNPSLFLATAYTVALITAIIMLMAYSQIPIIRGLVVGQLDARWMLHHRYWGVALAPVIVLTISLYYKVKEPISHKFISIALQTFISLNILFAYLVSPFFTGTIKAIPASFFTPWHYSPFMFTSIGDILGPTQFLVMSVFVGQITLIVYFLMSKQKLHVVSLLLLVFFIYHYGSTSVRFLRPQSQLRSSEFKTVSVLLDDVGITAQYYPYVFARVGNDPNLQFSLYRHRIVPITNEPGYPHFIDTAEIPIYITSDISPGFGSLNMFFGRDHKLVDFGVDEDGVAVDSNHQVLINTSDTALVAQIETAGYELTAFDTLHFEVDSLRFHRTGTVEELEFFLAPIDISLGVTLPPGNYELTLSGNDLSVEQATLPAMPDGIVIADNYLTYSFTLDYSRTLEEFFSADVGWGFVEYLLVNNIWYVNQLEDMKLRITERFPLRQLAAYELGTAIYFDEDNANYHGHILSGMPLQEESGAWTQGRVAEFVFFLSDTQRIYDDLVFSFTAEPLVTPPYLAPEPGQPWLIAQRVEIEVNGEVLDVMNIIRHGTYEVRIPAELIADGNRLHILLRFPTATSPAALGIDMDDDRVLALFFEEMRIFAIS